MFHMHVLNSGNDLSTTTDLGYISKGQKIIWKEIPFLLLSFISCTIV